uniref:Distal membrane-arm assembly complex protein 1-like domain-containing protein n=1 Tax=Sphaeramia orbicularis TaxID=375764 RepID=A0A672YBU1_9TELE
GAHGAPGSGSPGARIQLRFKNCWSCRLIPGGGLILCGAYVFNASRRMIGKGGPPTIGTVLQITFATSLAAWGIVVIADPVRKAQKKT